MTGKDTIQFRCDPRFKEIVAKIATLNETTTSSYVYDSMLREVIHEGLELKKKDAMFLERLEKIRKQQAILYRKTKRNHQSHIMHNTFKAILMTALQDHAMGGKINMVPVIHNINDAIDYWDLIQDPELKESIKPSKEFLLSLKDESKLRGVMFERKYRVFRKQVGGK